MAQPSVSVVLATFNGERFLPEQLDSILAQTLPPVEIVVGDDGSTDATLEILADYASHSPIPIRSHRNERRLGHTDNFFAAAGRATGELLAWSDQDDVWVPEKLERCAARFRDPRTTLVIHGAWRTDPAGNKLNRLPSAILPSYRPMSARPFRAPNGFRQVFRRSLLDVFDPAIRPINVNGVQAHHDEFTYFVAGCTGTIRWIRRPLALYRTHESNLSGTSQIRRPAAFSLRHRGSVGAELAAAAERRGAYLELLAQRQSPAAELEEPARWYRDYADSIRRRTAVHAARGRRGMLGEVRRAGLDRLYRPRRAGGLGLPALAKDLGIALVRGGPLVARHPPPTA